MRDDWRMHLLTQIMAGKSLSAVCREDGMPHRATVHEALAADPAFADRYARACEVRADAVFDDLFEISDDGSNDWMLENDPENPGYRLNGEHVQRSKLRIDARKWALARMNPKKYGDKLALGGADDLPPIRAVQIDATKLSTEALRELSGAMGDETDPADAG